MTARVVYLNHYRHELREFVCDRCGKTYEALAYHDTAWDWQTDAECPSCEELADEVPELQSQEQAKELAARAEPIFRRGT